MISKLLCSIFLTTVACHLTPLYAANEIDLHPNDFTLVAKKAIPAVVAIKTQEVKKSRAASKFRKSDPWGQEDFQTMEDFFQRFFRDSDEKSSSKVVSGQASGFIVSPDGYIMTNLHAVQDAGEIIVMLNDKDELPAKVIGQDNNTDIALIKIDQKDLPYLHFGNSDILEVGQWVLAVGAPMGLQATVTAGIVSAKGRNNLDLARIEDFIQTDAAINLGNSGGPLLNMQGEVIGINTAIVSHMGGNMGLGFAVPSNIAKNVMEQLMDHGSVSRSYIGVEIQKVDQNLAAAFNLPKPEGLLVAVVAKNSPAEKAGLRQGDIITKLNDSDVKSPGAFRTMIALMTPGSSIRLTILRNGKSQNVAFQTAEFSTELKKEEKDTYTHKLGIGLMNLTPDIAQKLGYSNDEGVVISQVDPGSIAQLAGLRKGTLIMAVNQRKVASVEEFNIAVAETEKNKPILFLVKEGRRIHFISLMSR